MQCPMCNRRLGLRQMATHSLSLLRFPYTSTSGKARLDTKRSQSWQLQAYSGKTPDVGDRVVAALPYLLPLLDAFPYGKHLFQYPYIARSLAPLAPLYALYTAFPLAPFLIFIAVYSGIVNNFNLPRFIRYNAMQAVLLDILLIIPSALLDNVFKQPQEEGLALQAYFSASNTIFLFVSVCVAYGVAACAVGQTPRLPLVAEAAESQLKDGPSGF